MRTEAWCQDIAEQDKTLTKAGYRFGGRGTHTSRTMMLAELTDLLAALPASAARDDYEVAVVEHNSLGKSTTAA